MNIIEDLTYLQSIVKSLPDPVFILSEDVRYLAVLGGIDSRYYHDGSGLVGLSLYEVLVEEKARWFHDRIQEALQSNTLLITEYHLGNFDVLGLEEKEGPSEVIYFEGRIQALPDLFDGKRAVLWMASNISKRHNLEVRLRSLCEIDELTGIYNRRKLLTELKSHMDEYTRCKNPLSLLMLDFDHFKAINDKYGHDIGDIVLKEITALCKQHMRSYDIFARYGGEEFIICMPNTNLEQAYQSAERMRQEIEKVKIPIRDQMISTTISIGLTQITPQSMTPSDIIKKADTALYKAKKEGRNRTVVA